MNGARGALPAMLFESMKSAGLGTVDQRQQLKKRGILPSSPSKENTLQHFLVLAEALEQDKRTLLSLGETLSTGDLHGAIRALTANVI